MNRPSLRALTIRLAARHPELRPALVEVLEKSGRDLSLKERMVFVASDNPGLAGPLSNMLQQQAPVAPAAPMAPAAPQVHTESGGNTAVVQQAPIVINQPPIVVQQQNSGGGEEKKDDAPATMLVTERTTKGFESDLLPELKRLVADGLTPERAAERVRDMVQEAFQKKNQLYNILIRHQATFETDAEYQEGLERLIQTWVADTADTGG